MNDDRELRLRKRIDTVVAQRDAAQAKLVECRKERTRLRHRVDRLTGQLDLWRHRARQWAKR